MIESCPIAAMRICNQYVTKNSRLKPRKKEVILFFPSTKHINDSVSIVIFKWHIFLWNDRINKIMMKKMTLDHRFHLLEPKKIVFPMPFLRNWVHKWFQSTCWQRQQWRRILNRCKSHERKLGFNLSSAYHIRMREKKGKSRLRKYYYSIQGDYISG